MLSAPDLPSTACPSGSTPPVEYVVHKDGKPFAILNATPALARRTIAGLALASPAASWSIERV